MRALEKVSRLNSRHGSRVCIRAEATVWRANHANRKFLAVARTALHRSRGRYVPTRRLTVRSAEDVLRQVIAAASFDPVAETSGEAMVDQATADEDTGGGQNVIDKCGMPVAIGFATCGTTITTGGSRSA